MRLCVPNRRFVIVWNINVVDIGSLLSYVHMLTIFILHYLYIDIWWDHMVDGVGFLFLTISKINKSFFAVKKKRWHRFMPGILWTIAIDHFFIDDALIVSLFFSLINSNWFSHSTFEVQIVFIECENQCPISIEETKYYIWRQKILFNSCLCRPLCRITSKWDWYTHTCPRGPMRSSLNSLYGAFLWLESFLGKTHFKN